MRSLGIITTAAVILLFGGCAYQVPRYSPEVQVASALKGTRTKLKVRVESPSFADEGSIVCRGVGPVVLPDGQSFSQYVADALRQELAASGIHDDNARLELSLRLQRVDFSSALGATNWYLDTEYTITDQKFAISTVYNDRSSYFGDKACSNMALYFRKAVGQHLREVFSHPTFRKQTGIALVRDSPPGEDRDAAGRLRKLDALYKDGLITKEEHERLRKQVLDGI